MRRATTYLFCLLQIILFPMTAIAVLPPLEQAMAELDAIPIESVEGIWEYPLDEVTVLIRRSRKSKGEYVMTVLEAFDTRLKTGDTIGILQKSAESKRFILRQYTERKGNVLSGLQNFNAELADNGESLIIRASSKVSFRLNPWRLLPRFLQLVRISTTSDKSPGTGLRRIYPSIDGEGLLEEEVVIL